MKLLKLMKEKPLTLLVYLPENNPEMAAAAEEAGADALIIRQNYDEEKVLKAVSIPVGLDVMDTESDEVSELLKLDFDFINFHHEVSDSYLDIKKTKVVALDEKYSLDKLMSITEKDFDALDATIIPPSHFGKELIVGDLQNYIAIIMSSKLPVIIPTQRSIKLSEVPIIWDTGAKGLMLTSVVLGDSIKSLTKAVKEYRAAVDDIDSES